MDLYKLINELNEAVNSRDLSDEYLEKNNCSTREEVGIGEYSYGITMVPADWVLPFLEELKQRRISDSYDAFPETMGR